MASRWRWDLPLFTKELLEQSARRRTYLIRIGFVIFVFWLAINAMESQLRNTTALTALGQGTRMLATLVDFEFSGIYLFLPAMACGVFTIEKERNTLPLLFLTRLGPWTIIFEKLLSRMLPMLMFLCCALPVMAFTYSMGGLTMLQLVGAAYFLMLLLFQVGCISVMCSAYAHSTASAFILTYVVIFVLRSLPAVLFLFVPTHYSYLLTEWFIYTVDYFCRVSNTGPNIVYNYGLYPNTWTWVLSPSHLYMSLMHPGAGMPVPPWRFSLLLGIPCFLSGVACLVMARLTMYRRATALAGNPLLWTFRNIDKVFFWLNRKVKFDVKLVRESNTLPEMEPIAWREVAKRSLGQFRYLVRIMVPMLFPVIFIGTFIAQSSANDWYSHGPNSGLTPLVMFLGIVDLALIAVTTANLIPSERTRQTWDVLRSMPMSGREMLSQKMRGVQRLQWVCSIPVLSAIVLQTWWRYQLLSAGLSHATPGSKFHDMNFIWWEYVIGAIGCLVLYTELVKWVSLWCGMVFRTSMRAILCTVPCLVACWVVPSAIVYLILQACFFMLFPYTDVDAVTQVNTWVGVSVPFIFIPLNETDDWRLVSSIPLIPAIVHITYQGLLLFVVRRHILKHAEWYLGRIGAPANRKAFRRSTADTTPDSSETPADELAQVAGATS